MEALTSMVTQASDFLWNVILIILLCGTGIMFTIRLKFIQVRKLKGETKGRKIDTGDVETDRPRFSIFDSDLCECG